MQPRVLIRRARPGDAPLIARVHVDSWRETYAGIMPQDAIERLSCEVRERQWDAWLSPGSPQVAYVAVDEQGRVVGFASAGAAREPERGFDAELYTIYLRKSYHRTGVGRRLVHALAHALDFYGFRSLMLWVLEHNPTVAFYRQLGGRVVGQKTEKFGGKELVELCYGFERLPLPRRFERIALGGGYALDLVRASDKEAYVESFKDREIYERTLHIPWPYTPSDAESYLTWVLGQRISHERDYTFVIREASGRLVGGLGFGGANLDASHTAELGYWIARAHRGKGVSTRAIAAACELAETRYGKTRLSATVFAWNIPSQRVLEKNGFTQEGFLRKAGAKDGVLHDEKIYARLARP
jgi:RimJ/RimL family protein N-acetyltransferase